MHHIKFMSAIPNKLIDDLTRNKRLVEL